MFMDMPFGQLIDSLSSICLELVLAALGAIVFFASTYNGKPNFGRPPSQNNYEDRDGSQACTAVKNGEHAGKMSDATSSSEVAELPGKQSFSGLRRLSSQTTSSGSDGTTSAGSDVSAGSDGSNSESPSPRSSSNEDNSNSEGASFETKAFMAKNIPLYAHKIRACGMDGDLEGAARVFQRLGILADDALILNSMVCACVDCNDTEKACEHFNRAKKLCRTDVGTYNAMINGYVSRGQESLARKLLSEMTLNGITATPSSYHGFMNARISKGDFRGAWKFVSEMQLEGVLPDATTCCILLQGSTQSIDEVSRVLVLVDAMGQPMDEALFEAVVDACIRFRRLDILTRQIEKMKRQGLSALSAQTYASMIQAYGQSHDTKRVWDLWDHMNSSQVQLTSITLVCMVDALIANGLSIEAWRLVQNMWKEQGTRPLVNTAVYSSILKGFASMKDIAKVTTVYEEMKNNQFQANIDTFNVMLNAVAQCDAMERAPALVEDMKAAGVEADAMTYSTLVKGFCQSKSLDKALEIFRGMQADGKYKPDEVIYNSLLSGCANESRPDDAIKLLAEMKAYDFAPSNHSMVMLVKLMERCRRLGEAQTMVESSKDQGTKVNIDVYTSLIQGFFTTGQTSQAIAVFDKILEERLCPDANTYTIMVRGCLRTGFLEKAVELTKRAHGLSENPPQSKSASPGLHAGCLEELVAALGGPGSARSAALMTELQERSAVPAAGPSMQRMPHRR